MEHLGHPVDAPDRALLEADEALVQAHEDVRVAVRAEVLSDLPEDLDRTHEQRAEADGTEGQNGAPEEAVGRGRRAELGVGGREVPPLSHHSRHRRLDRVQYDLKGPVVGHAETYVNEHLGGRAPHIDVAVLDGVVEPDDREGVVNGPPQRQRLKQERHGHGSQVGPYAREGRPQIRGREGYTIPHHEGVPHRQRQRDDAGHGHERLGTEPYPDGPPGEGHADAQHEGHLDETAGDEGHDDQRQSRQGRGERSAHARDQEDVAVGHVKALLDSLRPFSFLLFLAYDFPRVVPDRLRAVRHPDDDHEGHLREEQDREERVAAPLGLDRSPNVLHEELDRLLSHVHLPHRSVPAVRALAGRRPPEALGEEGLAAAVSVGGGVHHVMISSSGRQERGALRRPSKASASSVQTRHDRNVRHLQVSLAQRPVLREGTEAVHPAYIK
mmetsp:Transcript_18778/g.34835  ORF Transcript_18778/g.34835 Transcript_18778/m.34835 type:complete len:441 (-) Transcript_18778:719-2041(-)